MECESTLASAFKKLETENGTIIICFTNPVTQVAEFPPGATFEPAL